MIVPGVYAAKGARLSKWDFIRAVDIWAPADAVIGGWSAAYLHGEHWYSTERGNGVVDVFTSAEPRVPTGVRERRLRQPIPAADAHSPQESLLRLRIERSSLPQPVSQFEICEPSGHLLTIADLAYAREKVAIFYDGRHHGDPEQWRRDLRITARLADLGWQVVRVTKGMRPEEVIGHIASALTRARRDLRHLTSS
jgi:very-short-patch-repair endonuclease